MLVFLGQPLLCLEAGAEGLVLGCQQPNGVLCGQVCDVQGGSEDACTWALLRELQQSTQSPNTTVCTNFKPRSPVPGFVARWAAKFCCAWARPAWALVANRPPAALAWSANALSLSRLNMGRLVESGSVVRDALSVDLPDTARLVSRKLVSIHRSTAETRVGQGVQPLSFARALQTSAASDDVASVHEKTPDSDSRGSLRDHRAGLCKSARPASQHLPT